MKVWPCFSRKRNVFTLHRCFGNFIQNIIHSTDIIFQEIKLNDKKIEQLSKKLKINSENMQNDLKE